MGSYEHAPGGKPGQIAAFDADGRPVWLDPPMAILNSDGVLDVSKIRLGPRRIIMVNDAPQPA